MRDFIETCELAARIALFILSISVGMVVLLVGTKQALAASLRGDSVIAGEHIRLGDIFDNTRNADYVLGPAPQPGKEMILNAKTLYRIASSLNVDWHPSSSVDQIILRREATVVPAADITSALEQNVRKSGVDTSFSIAYLNAPDDIVLPAGTNETIEVSAFNFNPQNDSFTAVVVSPSVNNPIKRVNVSGRIERLVAVPVLKSSLKNGDVIGALDIDYIELAQAKIPNGTILKETDIIGMTPRRAVSGGRTLVSNDLERPKMVGRGDIITLIFESGPMILTAKGKSMQSGAIGDVVRVSSLDSNKSLQGTVTAQREVTIR